MVQGAFAVALALGLAATSLLGQNFSGYYEIVNAGSGMVLEVPSSSTNDGTDLDQWIANGGTNQEWTFGPAANPPVTFSIQSVLGTQITVQWSQGTLMQATNLHGPWTSNSASSPYIFTPSAPQQFFRQILY